MHYSQWRGLWVSGPNVRIVTERPTARQSGHDVRACGTASEPDSRGIHAAAAQYRPGHGSHEVERPLVAHDGAGRLQPNVRLRIGKRSDQSRDQKGTITPESAFSNLPASRGFQ